MERLAIVAHLKPGSEQRAEQLLGEGAPFDLNESGIARHNVYLSASEVVFVFEGHEIEWIVDELIDEPFHPTIQDALAQWREIVEGTPHLARERFGWERASDERDEPAASSSRWA